MKQIKKVKDINCYLTTWFCLALPCLVWFYLVLFGFTWLCLVIPGFAWFYLVLFGFTWFCLVLPGFAWLCLVLPGFAWLYLVLLALATFSTAGRRDGRGSSNTERKTLSITPPSTQNPPLKICGIEPNSVRIWLKFQICTDFSLIVVCQNL